MFCSILQGTKFGQKLNNQTNLRVAHLVTVNGRRTCNMSNVSIILVHPVQLNCVDLVHLSVLRFVKLLRVCY